MFRKMASNSEEIGRALKGVMENIQKATNARPKSLPQISPRLVAVGKTKPVSDIITAYKHGQRHFGENYVMELEEKARQLVAFGECEDIKWHFIGHLQRNKANKITVLPNLYMVETVDSQKLAQTLNNNWEKFKRPGKLKVMIQVNTSGEQNKSGCDKETLVHLTTFIRDKCPCLEFSGIMTIGAYGYNTQDGPNPDFLKLVKFREDLCAAIGLELSEVELSMGMSTDYEHAIELGSTNVRVGSTIFGARNVPHQPQSESTVTGNQPQSESTVTGNKPQSESSQSQPSESSQSDSNSQSENKCSQLADDSQLANIGNSVNQSESCVVNETVMSGERNCDTNSREVTSTLQNLNLV